MFTPPTLHPKTPPPKKIIVREKPRAWYHFVTTLCAVLGGVFTVTGILDGILHNTLKVARKMELGKQG